MSSILLERFNKFWINYPKKRNKGSAKKVWLRIKPGEELLKKMLAKIMEAKRSKDWQKDNGQFIPYPATWLSGECWDDEFVSLKQYDKPSKPDYSPPKRTGKTYTIQEVARRLMADIKKRKGDKK
jgi:hypothetical protein